VGVQCDTRWTFLSSHFYLEQLRHPKEETRRANMRGGSDIAPVNGGF
jgi:hypothetical protein